MEQTWAVGSLVRYSWLDAGIEDLPLAGAQTSSANCVFEHETGYDDNGSPMTNVFVESGDIDISSGENFTFMKKIIPDMRFVKDATISNTPAMNIVIKRRDFPNSTLATDSTAQVTESSTFASLRTRAREVVFRFESDDDNTDLNQKGYKWRLGSTRIDVQPSGRR